VIAINASILDERPSGLGQYALNVIRSLDALRNGLVVYTSFPDPLVGLRAVVRLASPLIRPERGLGGHLARLAWCQTVLRARVARDRPRVLFNTLPEGILRCGIPQVTTVHDLVPLLFPDEYPRPRYYFRHLVPALLRESRAVVADSEATRRQVIDAYRLPLDRVHVIPCGYDAARFRPDGPAAHDGGVPYVLYVGNLLPHKNLPRLIEAMVRVGGRVPVRLVVAGSGRPANVAVLTSLAARLGARVELRLYVPPEELPALYRGARVVALPSLAEGFGLTALEAMACGTPVVAANASSIPEVVGDAGLLVDPRDTDAIADAILRLLTDESLRRRLIAQGLTRAACFSWERTARQVLAVLDQVRD
jgi:glycosyltransferase involved in cell wall biosynthesis